MIFQHIISNFASDLPAEKCQRRIVEDKADKKGGKDVHADEPRDQNEEVDVGHSHDEHQRPDVQEHS